MMDYEIREALEWGCSVEEILEKIEKEGWQTTLYMV